MSERRKIEETEIEKDLKEILKEYLGKISEPEMNGIIKNAVYAINNYNLKNEENPSQRPFAFLNTMMARNGILVKKQDEVRAYCLRKVEEIIADMEQESTKPEETSSQKPAETEVVENQSQQEQPKQPEKPKQQERPAPTEERAAENEGEEKQPKRKNLQGRLTDFLTLHGAEITLDEKDKEKYVLDLRKAIIKCKHEDPSKEEANQSLIALLDKVMPDVALKLAFVKEFNVSVPIEQQEIDDIVELSRQVEESSAGVVESDEEIKALEEKLEAARAEKARRIKELEKRQKRLAEAKEKASSAEVADGSSTPLEIDDSSTSELSDEEAVQRLEELQQQEEELREELRNRKKARTREATKAFTENDLEEALLKLRCAKMLALGNSKHGNLLFDGIRSLAINTFYKIKIVGVKLKFRVGANKFKKGTAAKHKERADEIRETRRAEREAKEAEYQEASKKTVAKLKKHMETGELDQDLIEMLEYTQNEINAISAENDRAEAEFESEEELEEYKSRKDAIRQGGDERETTLLELGNENAEMIEAARESLSDLRTQGAVIALVDAFKDKFKSATAARDFLRTQIRVDKDGNVEISENAPISIEDLKTAGLIEVIKEVKTGPRESDLSAQDMIEILNGMSIRENPDTKKKEIYFDCLGDEEERETVTPKALEYMQALAGAEASRIPESFEAFGRKYQRNQDLLEEGQALIVKEYVEELQRQVSIMKEKVEEADKTEAENLSHRDRQEIKILALKYVENSRVVGAILSEIIKDYSEGERRAIAKGGRLLEDMARLADAGKAFSRDSEEIDPQEQPTSPDSHDEP